MTSESTIDTRSYRDLVGRFATGVTVIVATTGTPVAFSAVNGPMFPLPPDARPIDAALFVQL